MDETIIFPALLGLGAGLAGAALWRLDRLQIVLHNFGKFKPRKRADEMLAVYAYDSHITGDVAVAGEVRHDEAKTYMVSARLQWLLERAEGPTHGNIAAFIARCDLNERPFRNALSGANYLQMEDAISISKALGMPTSWIFEGDPRGCTREFIEEYAGSEMLQAYIREAKRCHALEDQTHKTQLPRFKDVRKLLLGMEN